MKKVDTSAITGTTGMPIKSGVINHVLQSIQEIASALTEGLLGVQYDATKLYAINGVLGTISGSTYTLNAGWIYYGGELYQVDATSFTVTGGQTGIVTLATTYATGASGDPIQFTDGVSRNVLQIRKLVIAAGTTGTGVTGNSNSDYANLIPVNPIATINTVVGTMSSTTTVNFQSTQNIFFGTGVPASGSYNLNWDFTAARQGTVVTLKVPIGASGNLTVQASGSGFDVYNVGGTITANKINFIYANYLGKNAAGNNEVRYTVAAV
jgi:hypothetical protein